MEEKKSGEGKAKKSSSMKEFLQRQEHILSALPVAIYATGVSEEHEPFLISDSVETITGFTSADFMQGEEFWQDRIHPEDWERVKNCFESELLEKESLKIEYRWLCKNNRYRWFLDSVIVRKDESGKPVEIFGVWVDITDQKDIQQSLNETLSMVEKLKKQLETENLHLQEEIKLQNNFNEIIGSSYLIRKVLQQIERVAPTETTVLISGETGTGKELVARAVHSLSKRNNRPLIKVNCAAIPSGLVESELFGHVKGSFTGAIADKAGKFEIANGGTIFLDELGELPLESQSKLLRVLQENELERVGGTVSKKVDVRVIAATNKNLEKQVRDNDFRSDLYYRLNVFPIHIPPLRERKEDIPLIANFFINKFGERLGKKFDTISEETLTTLQEYFWPGNIRELENVIERSVILNNGPRFEIKSSYFKSSPGFFSDEDYLVRLEDVEREHIIKILNRTNWKINGENGAAEILGINPSTLRSRMTKLHINRVIKSK